MKGMLPLRAMSTARVRGRARETMAHAGDIVELLCVGRRRRFPTQA